MLNERLIAVKIKKLRPDALLPTYAHSGDAGMDVYTPESFALYPETKQVIKVGFAVGIPKGFELQVRPRSGVSVKTWARISNSPGTIDSGYKDEVGIIMENRSDVPVYFKKGERIAQLVLAPVYSCNWQEVEELEDIGRGAGFGSSGR